MFSLVSRKFLAMRNIALYSVSDTIQLNRNMVIFQYFKLLRQHIMYKHETNKPWKCDKCDFSHAIKSGLDQHKGYYHPTENGLKVCDICGYSTPQLSNLKDHMGSVHAKKKNFTCNVCEKQFYAKRKMEKHIKSK